MALILSLFNMSFVVAGDEFKIVPVPTLAESISEGDVKWLVGEFVSLASLSVSGRRDGASGPFIHAVQWRMKYLSLKKSYLQGPIKLDCARYHIRSSCKA